MIAHLRQRLEDWQRERRIQDIARRMVRFTGRKWSPVQGVLWAKLKAECAARSPGQLARMDARAQKAQAV